MSKKLSINNLSISSFITGDGRNALRGGNKESIFIQCPYGGPDDTYDYDCVSDHQHTDCC